MNRTRQVLRTLLVLGALVAAVGSATFSAFSKTTASPGNGFTAGSVSLSDNDAGSSVVSLSAAAPGATSTGCITVVYGGSLDSNVRLYAALSGSLAPYLTLTVTRGSDPSPSFSSCSGFTADATNYAGLGPGVLYNGPVSSFPTSYATGIVDPTSATPETWTSGERHAYRFSVTLANNNAAQGLSETAGFTWEARNT